MASRKDQLHSYQFLLRRVISAVVMRETDPAQAPLRRGTGAAFAGVMIAVIVAAAFGVIGIFTKVGSTSWKQDGTVVVEKETGATYVYNNELLTPTLNYASALLLAGKETPTTVTVPRDSLAAVGRGIMRGIPDAPTALPDAKRVTGVPWTLCSVPSQDSNGHAVTRTSLAVGRGANGGAALGDKGLLVKDSQSGDTYLVWHSTRYQIKSPDPVVASLFGAQVNPTTVGLAWLNGLPAGMDIGPIDVPDRGKASSAVSGHTFGDVLFDRTGSGDKQYYLVLSDGVAAITDLQRSVLAGQYTMHPQEVPAAEINGMTKSHQLTPPSNTGVRPPSSAPKLTDAGATSTCALYESAAQPPQIVVGAAESAVSTRTQQQTGDGNALADAVWVPSAHVAVVRAMSSSSSLTGTYALVTDNGVRYGVPTVAALHMLGYQEQQAVSMPAGLVSRIPAGPTLDPKAAAVAVDMQKSGN
jgi:type VII secretion protein EccB